MITTISLIVFMFYCVGVVDPGGVGNLYGLWDWVGMAPRWHLEWDLSPVCAHSLWAGPCPEKLVNKKINTYGKGK